MKSYRQMSSLQRLLFSNAVILGSDGPGSTGGYNERADILTQAADGSDLNEIWADIAATLAIWNRQREDLMSKLTYQVTEDVEHVGLPGQTDFEEATEYGQPRGSGGYSYVNRGYDFKFYDLAQRFTWMFIAESSGEQLRNMANQALEADERLRFNKVMKTVFNPANLQGIADKNIPTTVVKFYNGDGEVPPSFKTNTFSGSHTHYVTTNGLLGSGGASLTSAALDKIEDDFYSHGYAPQQSGTKLVLMMNRQEGGIVRGFTRAGGAKYDFIPSSNYGGGVFLPMNGGIVARPTSEVPEEIGTYGPFHIVEDLYIPTGYVAGFASGGSFNINNPIGFREHKNPAYRGLQHIPGQRSDYPLTDSFFRRGFGTGVRQRGAGFIVQVTTSPTYTVPAIYA